MSLEEIQRQVENRLEALNIDNTKMYIKDGIEQLVISCEGIYIIVLDVLSVNKSLIDNRPTIVEENMYEKENSKYVIQEGFYLVDGMKGTQTIEQESTIVDTVIEYLTGSRKPKLKVLSCVTYQ